MNLLKYNERGAEAKWFEAFHYGENGRCLTMVGWLVGLGLTAICIGVGRFRILGGPRFRILGGPRGAKFPAGT